jgi:hypothetical protein
MKKIFIVMVAFSLLMGCAVPPASTPFPVSAAGNQPTLEPATVEPSATPAPTESSTVPLEPTVETPTAQPTLAAGEWKTLPVIPVISERTREIYQQGLAMGNDPTHFSKVGDCQNVASFFLSSFDNPGDYSLGPKYRYLTPTIDNFKDSWSRESLAVKGGFNVAAVLSPMRADHNSCNDGESPLACEMRVWKPSIVIISMETWWGKKPAEDYEKYMRQLLDYVIAQGAVPVLATKADNLEGNESINAVIAKLAVEYDIPLWNFWAAVQPLPDHGLSNDNFHLTFSRNYFDDPERMQTAWPWRNLTALQTIDTVYKSVK